MPVNTGPDINTYGIPEVSLSNTFNAWRDISNISAYKLNKLKIYEGLSTASIDTTTTVAGVLQPVLLPTVLSGHTFAGGIAGTTATFSGLLRANSGISCAGGMTVSGDLAVGGGDITTGSTTASLFNTNVTTLSIGGAATNVIIGSASANSITTIQSALTYLYGNITVGGCASSFNTNNLFVEDTVITLGVCGGVGVTLDQSRDRGVEFYWYDNSFGQYATLGFFGFDRSTENFTFYSKGVTSPNGIYSGVTGTFQGNFLGGGITATNLYVNSLGTFIGGITTSGVTATTVTATTLSVLGAATVNRMILGSASTGGIVMNVKGKTKYTPGNTFGTSDAVYTNSFREYKDLLHIQLTSGNTYGMLVLELPGEPDYTFINLYLSGYNYTSGSHWESVISGYSHKLFVNGWVNDISSSVNSSGEVPFNTVRFGQKAAATGSGSRVILLGVTGDQSTLWSYADISIDRLKLSYSGADHVAWERGITASFVHYQSTTSLGLSGGLITVPWEGLNGYSAGNYGIGTVTPTALLEVAGTLKSTSLTTGAITATTLNASSLATFVGGITASGITATTVNVQTSLQIAPNELATTQRTFTQVFSALGSGVTNLTVVGDAWLIGSFSDPNSIPAQFKFVHNSHTGNNLQSDLYEWARHYFADTPANTTTFSEWVELPVSISIGLAATRYFRFDVRKKVSGEMQLRMRATVAGVAGGPHYFTFTTTGSTIYTPAAGGAPSTLATPVPTGFHGRQSYEFPVSKGNYGFAGSTAGLFILNNGNVGIGTVSPASPLHIRGTPDQLLLLEGMGSSSYMRFTSNSLNRGYFGHFNTAGMYLINQRAASELDSSLYLGTADSVKLTITGNGNVGIGTTAPAVALDVVGAISTSGNLKLTGGSSTSLSVANTSNDSNRALLGWNTLQLGNNGQNRIVAGNTSVNGYLEFWVNNTTDLITNSTASNGIRAMTIASTGKVGIGTATPTLALQVVGSIAAVGGAVDYPVQVASNAIFVGGAGTPDSGRIIIGDGSGWKYKISNRINSITTDLVTFDDRGMVGIGTTTPKGKLHCIGEGFFDYAVDAAQGGGLRLTSNPNASYMAVNEYYDGTNLKFARTGGASSIRLWQTNDSTGGQIDFQVGKTGAANSVIPYETAMMIAANKKVGIGTGTPLAVLDVRGPTVTSNATMNHYSDLVAGSIQGSIQATLPNGGATGACQIILPYGLTAAIAGGTITPYGGDVMLRIKIMGHQYRNSASTYGASWEVIVHGYFASAYNTWSGDDNSVVEIRGNAPFSRVRLANKTNASSTYAGRAAILLGDDTTTWKLSDVGTVVQVTDVWTHYGNSTNWADGWVIENPLVPQTYISANYVAAMTVTPKLYQYMDMDGNLGLGTTGPTVKLDVVGGIKASTTLNVLGLGTFVGGITASGVTATTLNVLGASNHTGLGTFVGGITASSVTATTLNVQGLVTFVGGITASGVTATTLNVQGLGTFVGGITASSVTATTLNVQGLGTFVGGITASGITATTLNVLGLATFVGGITASGVTATTLNVLGASNHTGLGTFVGGITASGVTATTLNVLGLGTFVGGITASGVTATTLNVLGASNYTGLGTFVGGITTSGVTATTLNVLGLATFVGGITTSGVTATTLNVLGLGTFVGGITASGITATKLNVLGLGTFVGGITASGITATTLNVQGLGTFVGGITASGVTATNLNVLNTTTLKDLFVSGNLTFGGTASLINIQSTNVNVADTIIVLGSSGGVGITGDTTNDRGIAFFWNANAAAGSCLGFFGFDRATQNFVFYTSGATTGGGSSGGITGTFQGNFLGGGITATTLNVQGLGTFVGGITASGVTATTLNVQGLGTFVGGITASGVTATTLNVLGASNHTGLGTFVGGITASGITATTLNVLGLATFVGGITTSGVTATTLNVQGLGTFVGGITASGVTATTLNVQGLGTFVGGITTSGVTATTLNVLGASNYTGLGTFVGGITASGVTATTLNVGGLGTFVGGITTSGVTATTLNVLGASNHTGLGTFVGGITASGVTATTLNVLGAANVNRMILGSASTGGIVMNVKGKTKYTPGNTFGTPDAAYTNNFREYRDLLHIQLTSGNTYGMLVLELPGESDYTFINLYLSGYNYASGSHWESVISGYAYGVYPNGWLGAGDMSVNSSGEVPFNTVRFGQKAAATGSGSRVILLGVTGDQSTLWSFADISIDRLKLSYANNADHVAWERGITASFVHYQSTTSLGLSGGLITVPWEGLNGYSAGNYGIGTVTPTALLEVAGTLKSTSLTTGAITATTLNASSLATFVGGITASSVNTTTLSVLGLGTFIGGITASGVTATTLNVLGASNHTGLGTFVGGITASSVTATTLNVLNTIKTNVIQPLVSGGTLSIKQGDGTTEVLQIDGSGKLGIRMPSGVVLATPMTINHDSTGTVMPGLASYGGIHLHQSSGNNGFVGITSKATSTGTQGGFLIEGGSGFGTKLHLMTTNDYNVGMKHRVVVDQVGNVGIGTLTPTVALDVVGDAKISNGLTLGTSLTVGSAKLTAPSGTAPIFGARAWAVANWSGTAISLGNAGNITSAVQGPPGGIMNDQHRQQVTFTFTTPMPTTDYVVSIIGQRIQTTTTDPKTMACAIVNRTVNTFTVTVEANDGVNIFKTDALLSSRLHSVHVTVFC